MRPRARQAGFTYLGLIIFVFIIGLVGAATLKVGALLQRAQAEHELLEIGAQFSAALKSYADATPRGQPPQPMSLQELLRDTRFPNPRRHLRKIFVDPVGGKAEWGLVRAGEGGRILGVHSLSQAAPLKLANFDSRFRNFENREHLSEWKFMAEGGDTGAPARPGAPQQPDTGMAPPAQEAQGQAVAPAAPQAAFEAPSLPRPEAQEPAAAPEAPAQEEQKDEDEPPREEEAPRESPPEPPRDTPREPPGQAQESGR